MQRAYKLRACPAWLLPRRPLRRSSSRPALTRCILRCVAAEDVVAHASTVNCVRIGRRSSGVMVTGGDDKRVNMWAIGKPHALLVRPRSNRGAQALTHARRAIGLRFRRARATGGVSWRALRAAASVSDVALRVRAWRATRAAWSASPLTRPRRRWWPAPRAARSRCST